MYLVLVNQNSVVLVCDKTSTIVILEKWFPFVRERANICKNKHEHQLIQNQNEFAFLHLLVKNMVFVSVQE